jgi:hypothetical protein
MLRTVRARHGRRCWLGHIGAAKNLTASSGSRVSEPTANQDGSLRGVEGASHGPGQLLVRPRRWWWRPFTRRGRRRGAGANKRPLGQPACTFRGPACVCRLVCLCAKVSERAGQAGQSEGRPSGRLGPARQLTSHSGGLAAEMLNTIPDRYRRAREISFMFEDASRPPGTSAGRSLPPARRVRAQSLIFRTLVQLARRRFLSLSNSPELA